MSREPSYCEKYKHIIDPGKVELYDGFYGTDSYGNKFVQFSGSNAQPALLRSIDVCNKNPDFKFDDKEKKLIDTEYNRLLKHKFKKSKRHSKSKSKTIKKPKNNTNKRSTSKNL